MTFYGLATEHVCGLPRYSGMLENQGVCRTSAWDPGVG